MGIQDGTRIKAHLRGLGGGAVVAEASASGVSRSYDEAGYWIIDVMLDI